MPGVPYREGEHPVQIFRQPLADLLVEMHQHLRVALRGKVVPPLQVLPQLQIVVDLPVEYYLNAAILVSHGLGATGYVDDAQPAVSKRNLIVQEFTVAIGPAVPQTIAHWPQKRTVCRQPGFATDPAIPHL